MSPPLLHYSRTHFPAPVARTRVVGEFILTETRYGADARLPRHAHEYGCLVLVLQGSFQETVDSQERTGEPGMVIVRPEGEPHSDRFTRAGGRCLNVELSPAWTSRVREQTRVLDRSAAFPGHAMLGRRMQDELGRNDDVSALAVESLLLSLVAELARSGERPAGSVPPPWLQGVRERMHDDPSVRMTLDDLASGAGVHPVHLATTFRRFFGVTVASYVRQLRVEYACRQLAGSSAPLSDIALAAGFADQSHFGRTFKRATRMTPAAYRAAFLKRVPRP